MRVFLPQERDDVGLLTMEPATQRGDQQLERKHAWSLRDEPSIHLWNTTGLDSPGYAVIKVAPPS